MALKLTKGQNDNGANFNTTYQDQLSTKNPNLSSKTLLEKDLDGNGKDENGRLKSLKESIKADFKESDRDYANLYDGSTMYYKDSKNRLPFEADGLIDKISEIFRGGTESKSKQNSEYEDPIIQGFHFDIDMEDITDSNTIRNETQKAVNINDESIYSPLFRRGLYSKGVGQFLSNYCRHIPELMPRIPIYHEFCDLVGEIFKSNYTSIKPDGTQRSKNHYITSIKGLDKLKKRAMNSGNIGSDEDNFIEMTIMEDSKMTATMLAYLYNSLVQSNVNHKHLIPRNLLKFKAYIRISEMRNMTSIGDILNKKNMNEYDVVNYISRNISNVTYTLYNCEFDFKDSTSWGDELSMGGQDTNYDFSKGMSFKIRFDSFSKSIKPTLAYKEIQPEFMLDDSKINMNLSLTGNDPELKIIIGGQTYFVENRQRDNMSLSKDYSDKNNEQNKKIIKDITKIPNNIFNHTKYMNLNPTETKTADDLSVQSVSQDTKNPNDVQIDKPKKDKQDKFKSDLNNTAKEKKNDLKLKAQNTFSPTIKDSQGNEKPNPAFIGTKALNSLETRFTQFLTEMKYEFNKKRAELFSRLVRKVNTSLGVQRITPSNVYRSEGVLGKYMNLVKGDIGFELNTFLKSSFNNLFK